MSRRWQPTAKEREQVSMMMALGIPQIAVCAIMGVTDKTLNRACRYEITTGRAKANITIGAKLFQVAKLGRLSAATLCGSNSPTPDMDSGVLIR